MSNGFVLPTRLLPSAVGHLPRLDTAAPSLQLHYGAFSATAGSSAPVSCFGNLVLIGSADLDVSLGIKTTGSHVPCKSPSRSHAAFEPDAAWAGLQVSAQTHPEIDHQPRFWHHPCLFDRSSTVCFLSSLRDPPRRDHAPPFLQRCRVGPGNLTPSRSQIRT